MTVNASVPAKSVREVIALAKAQPGGLAFASSGNGGAPHLAGELFKRVTGTDLLHVPYRGSGPAVVDVVAGRIAIMFDAAPALLPFITADKLRVLAAASASAIVCCPTRRPSPSSAIAAWRSRSGTASSRPPARRSRSCNGSMPSSSRFWPCRRSATASPSKARIAAGGSAEQFAAFMREESARWGEVVKQAGIKAE